MSFVRDSSATEPLDLYKLPIQTALDKAWETYKLGRKDETHAEAQKFLVKILHLSPRGDIDQQIKEKMRLREHYQEKHPQFIPGAKPDGIDLDSDLLQTQNIATRHALGAPGNSQPFTAEDPALQVEIDAQKVSTLSEKEFKSYFQRASLRQSHTLLEIQPEQAAVDIERRRSNCSPQFFQTPPEKFQILIYDGKFHKQGKLFDTSNYFAHDKSEYAAFTINIYGELSAFRHDAKSISHADMNGGAPVFSSGELCIKNGELIAINTRSGHYEPSLYNLYQTLCYFARMGIDTSKTKIQIYNTVQEKTKEEKQAYSEFEALNGIHDKCYKEYKSAWEKFNEAFNAYQANYDYYIQTQNHYEAAYKTYLDAQQFMDDCLDDARYEAKRIFVDCKKTLKDALSTTNNASDNCTQSHAHKETASKNYQRAEMKWNLAAENLKNAYKKLQESKENYGNWKWEQISISSKTNKNPYVYYQIDAKVFMKDMQHELDQALEIIKKDLRQYDKSFSVRDAFYYLKDCISTPEFGIKQRKSAAHKLWDEFNNHVSAKTFTENKEKIQKFLDILYDWQTEHPDVFKNDLIESRLQSIIQDAINRLERLAAIHPMSQLSEEQITMMKGVY